ncbi:cytochrome P450 [Actinoplanes sp. TFC3]|uniref:cytochrome P450 family protein n=1 Tax=Actinoplanes sp. TFC3 TaxID=1710355 RepID=UPI001F476EF9|nr:cytochrome P450 [Actinoplanes sp. TFC3]
MLGDPLTAYGQAREQSPVIKLMTPGFGFMWAVTRYDEAKAMLADPRLELNANTFLRPAVPEHCLQYMRTMTELDAPEHARLRRVVSPAFTARRAAQFRTRIDLIVGRLLDTLAEREPVDLVTAFARPLPMEVICELVGIPAQDRPAWREYGAAIAAVDIKAFGEAIPAIIHDAIAAVARRSAEPEDDLLSDLIGGGRLTTTELVTLVWHLVLAGQTPANLITNAIDALKAHPDQETALRADPTSMPAAVEELTRWCSPQPLSLPRFASEDLDIGGVAISRGEPVVAAIACANRDPRAFTNPDTLDLKRQEKPHIAYAHGPHFCFGAPLARVQVEAALSALLTRFPAMTVQRAEHLPDPGTWRLKELVVTLAGPHRRAF